MQKILNAIPLMLAGFTPTAMADDMIHKCQDAQGKLIYQAAPCSRSEVNVSAWSAQAQAMSAPDDGATKSNLPLILKQQGNGHYFVGGAINGKALTFVVDTGASVVSLPRSLAYQANMSCKDQVTMQTANGSSFGCTGIIARLKIGQFLFKDVPAMIAPNLGQPLLGMNVLQQFRIEQDNGEMRLTPKN